MFEKFKLMVNFLEFFKFKKKKPEEKHNDLEEVFNQGLITKEEFLKLKKDRAETELKEYLKNSKKR
jgi:hypothetical protein